MAGYIVLMRVWWENVFKMSCQNANE